MVDHIRSKERMKDIYGYTAWELPEHEREKLLKLIPPAYPDVVAHHVTDQFGVISPTPLSDITSATIVGVSDDGEGVQALVVSVGGTVRRHDGKVYHITWSLDRAAGAKPYDSNRVIEQHGVTRIVSPIGIELTPKFFPNK